MTVIFSGYHSPGLKKDQLPGLSEIQSLSGDIYISNITIIDPNGEKVLPGMDILIR